MLHCHGPAILEIRRPERAGACLSVLALDAKVLKVNRLFVVEVPMDDEAYNEPTTRRRGRRSSVCL